MQKSIAILQVTILFCIFLTCSKTGITNLNPYIPSIQFAACFNFSSTPGACTPETLSGNFFYPNRCSIATGAVHMFFYSDTFALSPPKGTQIHMVISRVDSEYIATGDVIFHMACYSIGPTNLTYEVYLQDTMTTAFNISMKIGEYRQVKGATVSLSNITVHPHSIGQGSMPLELIDGLIWGKM